MIENEKYFTQSSKNLSLTVPILNKSDVKIFGLLKYRYRYFERLNDSIHQN